VRFSLGAGNTEAEVDEVAALAAEIVAHIRSL
jgi:cysteine sulfinate desulfinase/cysteine desulfurase-like protein